MFLQCAHSHADGGNTFYVRVRTVRVVDVKTRPFRMHSLVRGGRGGNALRRNDRDRGAIPPPLADLENGRVLTDDF